VIKKIECDTFGNILGDSNPAFAVPFGFAGGLHDKDTGLVRFGYRDYDPETGKWTAKDPILFAGGDTDLYGYCVNDPVNFTDEFGLTEKCVIKYMLVTAYCDIGPGKHWSFYKDMNGGPPASVGPGTVAVADTAPKPYPFASTVTVYGAEEDMDMNVSETDYQGEVHDTGAGWDSGHHNVPSDQWIDIWLPCGDARKWGKQWRFVKICYEDGYGLCP